MEMRQNNYLDKMFVLMIIVMMSIIIVTNSILLYSVQTSLSNQIKLLEGQNIAAMERNALLENISDIQRNQRDLVTVSAAEQSDAINQILDFINRTDATLNQTPISALKFLHPQ